jgi:hypothetical protein
MDDDKIIADYVRMYHSEILYEPKYAVLKAAYPQLEQVRDVIVDTLQVIYEAIQPAIGAIADAIIEQERLKQEEQNDS